MSTFLFNVFNVEKLGWFKPMFFMTKKCNKTLYYDTIESILNLLEPESAQN